MGVTPEFKKKLPQMPLTDTEIRNKKPAEKPVKLFDGRGLFLIVTPAGGKWWRFRYKFDDKEKLLSLGIYPDVGLKGARERRDAARKLLADGIDPGENRKAQKSARADWAANSFGVVVREWFAKFAPDWLSVIPARLSADWKLMYSRGSGHPNCWPWCAALKTGERLKPRAGLCSTVDRHFTMRWRRDGRT